MKKEIKCIQHADDSTFPLRDKSSLEEAIQTIENFGNVSETKLNLSKTECILLGKLWNIIKEDTTIRNIKKKINTVKCLGIFERYNKTECNEKHGYVSWESSKKMDSWRIRKLTLFGKCQIINSSIVSKLLYVATIIENPD